MKCHRLHNFQQQDLTYLWLCSINASHVYTATYIPLYETELPEMKSNTCFTTGQFIQINLLIIVNKVMEETIIRTIDDDLISEAQFRFRPKYNSWIPYTFARNMDKILNSSGEVRITGIDIKTAFDRIQHQMARIRHRVARLEQTRSKRNLPRRIISPTK